MTLGFMRSFMLRLCEVLPNVMILFILLMIWRVAQALALVLEWT